MKKIISLLLLVTSMAFSQTGVTPLNLWQLAGNTINTSSVSLGTKNSKMWSIISNNKRRIDIGATGINTIWADSSTFDIPFRIEGGSTVNGANPYMQLKGYYIGAYRILNNTTGREWWISNNTIAGSYLDVFSIGRTQTPSNGFFIITHRGKYMFNGYKSNALTQYVSIDTTGVTSFSYAVGIGTVTPASGFSLHVVGSETVSGGVSTPSIISNGQLNLMAPSGSPIIMKINNTAYGSFYANESYLPGKVMVNSVLTPVANMHIMGTMSTQSTYSAGGRVEFVQGADVASAVGAITLGGDGNVFEITGTSAITLISSTSWQNGSEITLLFTSTASLTDGTANSGANIGFELAGNANFTGSADDSITLVLCEIGGTQRWREKCRSVN